MATLHDPEVPEASGSTKDKYLRLNHLHLPQAGHERGRLPQSHVQCISTYDQGAHGQIWHQKMDPDKPLYHHQVSSRDCFFD